MLTLALLLHVCSGLGLYRPSERNQFGVYEYCRFPFPSLPGMEDSRFRPQQQAPRNEPPVNPLVSPSRGAARIPQQQQRPQQQQQQLQQPSSHDLRSSLPRRFTTDSGRIPTLSTMSSLTSPPRRTDISQDYNGSQEYNNVSCYWRPGCGHVAAAACGAWLGLLQSSLSCSCATLADSLPHRRYTRSN